MPTHKMDTASTAEPGALLGTNSAQVNQSMLDANNAFANQTLPDEEPQSKVEGVEYIYEDADFPEEYADLDLTYFYDDFGELKDSEWAFPGISFLVVRLDWQSFSTSNSPDARVNLLLSEPLKDE